MCLRMRRNSLKKKSLVLVAVLIVAAFSSVCSFAAHYTCNAWTNLGSTGKTRVYWKFRSGEPRLRYSYSVYKGDGSLEYREVVNYLTENKVCGQSMNFHKSCRVSERRSNRNYRYSFRCVNGTSGQITFINRGSGSFYCYRPGGSNERVTFRGCRLRQ